MFHENWVWFGWGWVTWHSIVVPFKPHQTSRKSSKRTTNRPMREQKNCQLTKMTSSSHCFFSERRRKSKNFFLPFEKFVFLTQSGNLKNFHESSSGGVNCEDGKSFFIHLYQSQGASTSHDKSWVASSLSAGCHDISPEFCCVASASAFFLLSRSISSIRCDERIEWKACKRGGKKLLGRKSWNFHFSLSLSPNRVLDNVTF